MSYNNYPNGAGGVTGDEVAVNKPIYMGNTGHVWYVSSLTGVDAASPAGRERERPLATFNQAFTNATAGDAIIFLQNHAETIAAAIAVNKALTIVSEGTGSSRAKLTAGNAGTTMLTLSATGTSFNNVYFPASTGTPTSRIATTAAGIVCDNCYFECGANDTTSSFRFDINSNSCQLTNAYFLATASQPGPAVLSISALSGLFLEDVTVDGGSFGYNGFAISFGGVLTALYANEIHQLNNADVSLAAGWTGPWIPGNVSGSARFEG